MFRLAGGNEGSAFYHGGVGTWEITPDQRLRAFATLYQRGYDGDFPVLPAAAAMPPAIQELHQYSPSWAWTEALNSNIGVLYDARIGGSTIDLAAFHSAFDIDRTDYTLLTVDRAGHTSATTFRGPDRNKRSTSTEARLGRQFDAGGINHLATLSLRAGRSVVDLTSSLAISLGTFDLRSEDPPDGVEPPWSGTRGEEAVEQVTALVGYGLAWSERVQLRFAVHRTRYDKKVLTIAGIRTEGVSETTLYNTSAIVSLTDRTAGSRGVRRPPTSAINRDDVLPPVEAEQFELGLRHAITPGLTVIGAAFDVSKPTNGFRANGSFGLVGQVRHRGVEGSIAGQLDANTGVDGYRAMPSGVLSPIAPRTVRAMLTVTSGPKRHSLDD